MSWNTSFFLLPPFVLTITQWKPVTRERFGLSYKKNEIKILKIFANPWLAYRAFNNPVKRRTRLFRVKQSASL